MTNFRFELEYRIPCSVCGEIYAWKCSVSPHSEMPFPALPSSWREFGSLALCQKHKVEIVIDHRKMDL